MQRGLEPSWRCSMWLGFFILLPGATGGQPPPQRVGREIPDLVQNWENRLQEAEKLLQSGDSGRAYVTTDVLVDEMGNSIEEGPGAARILARAVFLRAVSEAGRGHRKEASWDWYTAHALDAEIARMDLSSFGEAGRIVDEIRTPPPTTSDSPPIKKPREGEIKPPRKMHGSPPYYPLSLHASCKEGTVVVETIVNKEGTLQMPRILESPNPVLSLAALESIRNWKFKPAVYQRRPIKVYYMLTLDFKSPTCTNPAARKDKKDRS